MPPTYRLRPILLLLATGALVAQQQDARPAYEAASIKLNTAGSGSSSHGSKSQVLMTHVALRRLVERAYAVQPNQVIGPAWLENVFFDIAAKYPSETKTEDRAVMLRTLLEDRLKLIAHRETKDLPGYALVAAKSGFRLKPVEPGPYHMSREGAAVEILKAQKASMALLTDDLARILGGTVIDRTGIEGVFDFQLRWQPNDPDAKDAADSAAALFAAVQEALGTIGLHLQAQKVPVEVVVVDHVERAPIEN